MSEISGMLDLDEIFNEAAGDGLPSSAGEVAEKPSGHLPDEKSIPVPQKKEIDEESYNSILANLKRSFKESTELIEMLESLKVVETNSEDLQDMYTEQAIFESYCDGPYYEKVTSENKAEVKTIARNIRRKFLSAAHDMKVLKGEIDSIVGSVNNKSDLANMVVSLPESIPYSLLRWGIDLWILDPILISKFNNSRLKLYAWQTICYVYGKGMKLSDIKSKLNEMYKEDLGDKYEIELIKMKFFWSTVRGKKELTDEEKNTDSNTFNNYLLIVNEKGTAISNREEEVKVEGDEAVKTVSALKATEDIEPKSDSSIKEGFKKFINKIKSKFSKKEESSDDKKDE